MVRGRGSQAKTYGLEAGDPNDCELFMYLNLKLQLYKTGMRQNRLAQLLGVDESVLSKTLNGFREPGQEMRRRIATLLDCDEQWLFERADGAGTPAKNGVAHLIR
jgi:transcriptional regulator with XRE-family HTH domain